MWQQLTVSDAWFIQKHWWPRTETLWWYTSIIPKVCENHGWVFNRCSLGPYQKLIAIVFCVCISWLAKCFRNWMSLMAHNWQKWKRVFLTCPCHEIYRDEAVGLKSYNYTLKVTIFVNTWNLKQFLENLIFCQ